MFYFAIVSTYFGLVEKYQSEIHHYLINPTSARSPHGKKGALSGLISLMFISDPLLHAPCPKQNHDRLEQLSPLSFVFMVDQYPTHGGCEPTYTSGVPASINSWS